MSLRGSGRAFLAFDIGLGMDLEAAAARLRLLHRHLLRPPPHVHGWGSPGRVDPFPPDPL